MADARALYRLMSWLSPSYPVGAFAYSHGLEHAVETGRVADVDGLAAWVDAVLISGTGRIDGPLFRETYAAVRNGDADALAEIAELGAAFQATAEFALESGAQGAAFLKATRSAWPAPALEYFAGGTCFETPASPAPQHEEENSGSTNRPRPEEAPEKISGAVSKDATTESLPTVYPVAVGAACAAHGIALEDGLSAYFHAFAANLVSAGVRLVPLGQSDGQAALAGLEPSVAAAAARALDTPLDDMGSAAPLLDLDSMLHETQYSRLFRS